MENKEYCNDAAANTETPEGLGHTFNVTPADAKNQMIAENMPMTDKEHESEMDADINVDKDKSTLPRVAPKQEAAGLTMTDFYSKPGRAPRKRNTKTAREKTSEYETILADLAEGKNPRETRYRLNLTPDQYNRHISAAWISGELSQQPKDVAYAIIRFGGWQTDERSEFRERLELNIQDSALLKFEKHDGHKIICSIIDAENNLRD